MIPAFVTTLANALVLVMGIGVYAAYNFGLKDVVLPAEETTAAQVIAEVPTAEQGEEEQEAVPEYSVAEPSYIISLQGLKDSPEFQAMAEWIKFERGYDQDWAILDTVGNGTTEWDEQYNNNG